MLDLFIGSSRTLALKEAITDAIESGQFGTLADDIRDCFTEDQIEQIEGILDTGDFDEVIDNVLGDWSGDSLEELLEELIEILAESEIELSFDEEPIESEEVIPFDDEDDPLDEDDDDDFSPEEAEEY